MVCHACAERERARKRYDRSEHGAPPGMYLAIHQRDDLQFGR